MPKVKKANREVIVEESLVNSYLIRGYDQIDEDGNIVKRATGGRTVSIGEFNKIAAENEKLKKSPANTDKLEKENQELKDQIKELKEEVEAYEKEIEKLEAQSKQTRK